MAPIVPLTLINIVINYKLFIPIIFKALLLTVLHLAQSNSAEFAYDSPQILPSKSQASHNAPIWPSKHYYVGCV